MVWKRHLSFILTRRRRQMEKKSALLDHCEGNPRKMQMTQSFDVFFGLRLNKRLSKQLRRRWFETPLRPSWRPCNELQYTVVSKSTVYAYIRFWFNRRWLQSYYDLSVHSYVNVFILANITRVIYIDNWVCFLFIIGFNKIY